MEQEEALDLEVWFLGSQVEEVSHRWIDEQDDVTAIASTRRQLKVVIGVALEPRAFALGGQGKNLAVSPSATAHDNLRLVEVKVLILRDVGRRRLLAKALAGRAATLAREHVETRMPDGNSARS